MANFIAIAVFGNIKVCEYNRNRLAGQIGDIKEEYSRESLSDITHIEKHANEVAGNR